MRHVQASGICKVVIVTVCRAVSRKEPSVAVPVGRGTSFKRDSKNVSYSEFEVASCFEYSMKSQRLGARAASFTSASARQRWLSPAVD